MRVVFVLTGTKTGGVGETSVFGGCTYANLIYQFSFLPGKDWGKGDTDAVVRLLVLSRPEKIPEYCGREGR